MAGCYLLEAEPVGEKGCGVELDVRVAGDARVRGLPVFVGAYEVAHDTPVEELLEVEREVWKPHPVRRVAGEEHRIRRAARPASLLTVVQPESHGRHVVAGLLEEQSSDGGVYSPAHRRDDALRAAVPGTAVALDEHLAGLAVEVVLEGLVQRVEDQRQRVLLAQR